ncbi:lyase family protein [Roseicyclus elongatus]|uniref:hypothetical protein n=1 Tax=Roseicyclus elongatus TaxID=159346 RepID=UPI0004B2B019
MSVTPFDSALYRGLFGDDEIARLFSDTAELRAMMLVMGTLARVQGRAGVIPEVSGAFLHRAAMEVQIDPAGLAAATARNGVTVPGLVTAFRAALNAPEHAPYLHWGATSQDVQDTALMLRLRQALMLIGGAVGPGVDRAGRSGRGRVQHRAGGAHLWTGGHPQQLRRPDRQLGRAADPRP